MELNPQELGFDRSRVTDPNYVSTLRESITRLREAEELPPEENQAALASRFQHGDTEAGRELVRSNRRLIHFVVAGYDRRLLRNPQSLITAASSMLDAARQYSPHLHGPFAEYAGVSVVNGLWTAKK
jgi:DNA-directed RNA polymerase sigma subunit (sigma70/sigma32)